MAYVKTTWETGDVITAEKLNNMEGGIEANGPFIVTIRANETETGTELVLDKTVQEISDALNAGKYCPLYDQVEDTLKHIGIILCVSYSVTRSIINTIETLDAGTVKGEQYTAVNADDYPSRTI